MTGEKYTDIYAPITQIEMAQIPENMKAASRWICWGSEKIPVSVGKAEDGTHYGIDVTKPVNWGTFAAATKAIGDECFVRGLDEEFHVAGVGFVVGDGWYCIDMDGGEAHKKENVPETALDDALNTINTYAEKSVSGCGYHLFGRCDFNTADAEHNKPHRGQDGNPVPESYEVEFFTRRKFIAITGRKVNRSNANATNSSAAAMDFYTRYVLNDWKKDEAKRAAERARVAATAPVNNDDAAEMFRLNYPEILASSDSSNFKRGGLGVKLAPGEYSWIAAVKAMQEIGVPESAIMDWCRRGSNFKSEKDVLKVLNKSSKPGAASVAGIIKDAQAHGWKPTPDKLTGECKKNHEAAEAYKAQTSATLPAIVDDGEKIPALITYDADYFNNTEIVPPEPIIEEILYPGLGMLGSPAKMGKSYMMLQLAVCVATGQPFMGFKVVRPGPVLYMDLQGTPARTQKRLKSMGYMEMPQGVSLVYKARTTDTGLLEQIKEWIASCAKSPSLIIIDMLEQVKGSQRRTEDAYRADNRILGPLHSIAFDYNLCVFCVMHTRKSNKPLLNDDPFNEIIGSIAQFGTADCAWMIIGNRTDDNKRFSSICRDNDDGQQDYEAQFNNHRWSIAGTVEDCAEKRAFDEYNQNPIVYTLRKLLKESGGSWSATMTDLINEVAQRTKEYPAPTPEKMARAIQQLEYRLAGEGIEIQRPNKNGGNTGRRYRFYIRQPEQHKMSL